MSIVPFFCDYLDTYRPSRILDQHFGLGLDGEDILDILTPRRIRRALSSPYYRPWSTRLSRKDVGSTVKADKDKFQVNLDVQQFSPEEITVKASDNTITVEGKHEEKEDEHGYISRHFVRKYTLPKGHDIAKCVSKLSSDGVLTITAPKVEEEEKKSIDIPITMTNQPSRIEMNGEVCNEEVTNNKCEKIDHKKNNATPNKRGVKC